MDKRTLDRFMDVYNRLLVRAIQSRFDFAQPTAITDEDARFLITAASELALGDPALDEGRDADWKRWAYDVATRLVELKGKVDARYVRAAEIILARLGNFPGRDYVRSIFAHANQVDRYPAALAIEALAHEAENTIDFTGLGTRTLTDFQVKLLDSLRRGSPVSVSAPTSAGKSFLLTLDIVSNLAARKHRVIVYIVPTRALIRQVITDLLARLREGGLDGVAVSGAPIALDAEQLERGVVYVLTQERLLSLLYSADGCPTIDALYVDEAQEIGDGDRGMILHSAVREVIGRFPAAKVCFASPLTSNPGFLLSEFEVTERGEFFVERQTPVSQALIILEKVKGRGGGGLMAVRTLTPTGPTDIGRVDIPFKFAGVVPLLANVAIFVTKENESTIVYANRPSDAIEIATTIADSIETKTMDSEVKALIDFSREHIHSQYALVDTLAKGVAFHYGKMPHVVRTQVEELLRARKLQYVVCTSTLLQGINLPARNIVILAPRKGNSSPMEGPDFWNLAGRAGRLRESFSGNIWCLAPGDWEKDPINGERLSEMTSSFRECLEDEQVRDALVAVLDNAVPLNSVTDRGRVEQLFGKVYSEFTCKGKSIAESIYAENADKPQLSLIDAKCQSLKDAVAVPPDVCSRNSVISPLSLDTLWKRFQAGPIEYYIPPDPRGPGAVDRMKALFRVIDEVFIGSGTQRWEYFATLAYWWVRGTSLKELIANHLKWNRVASTKAATNSAIRTFLDNLETDVRFVYVKYLKAYADALHEFLTIAKRDDLVEKIAPLHLYIEYGASDRVLVMLMSLGLSRSTAIFIRNAITTNDEIGREECWQKLKSIPLRVLDVPELCKAEIRQLTGQAETTVQV